MIFWLEPITFLGEWLRGVFMDWNIPESAAHFLVLLLGAFVLAVSAMMFVIFLIWLERKVIGRIQDRYGPNRVGPWGIFQPFADMAKIFAKEIIIPAGADKIPYLLAPILSVGGVLLIWAVVPFAVTIFAVDLNVGVLYLIAAGAVSELGVIFAGWGSNNKYALLAAFRAIAQLISYEIPMVITMLIPVMLAGSMSLNDIVKGQTVWYIVLAPVSAMIFFITQLAEVGRSPFDLTEAESEIVAGFNIEYSGLNFGMFYVAEFLHAFTVSMLFAVLFLGGWDGPLAETYPFLGVVYMIIKTSAVYSLVILVRGALPRFRIDQMMDLNWKILTPLSLVMVILTALMDKALTIESQWGRAGIFIAANLVVFIIMSEILTAFGSRRKRKLVVPKPLSADAAEKYSTQSGNGV
ncbi:MAG: NADH-quinone oxidoreductase subunit NuoH [Anaerolineaceae bacterium]